MIMLEKRGGILSGGEGGAGCSPNDGSGFKVGARGENKFQKKSLIKHE